ncbi:MAG TPA: triose-phosphate isomerase, partial [Myxococcaceae bacterium]|nr:triose-phosphate isomerase [Myxococcaceae bacterium]
MARRPIVAGNWKMHKTVGEAVDLVSDLRELVSTRGRVEVVVAPPFTALAAVQRALAESDIALAGQNCHWEPAGAFTGEVSAPMLKDVGCRYVIVGHSERRQYFGEDDELIGRKGRTVLDAGMRP